METKSFEKMIKRQDRMALLLFVSALTLIVVIAYMAIRANRRMMRECMAAGVPEYQCYSMINNGTVINFNQGNQAH